MTILSLITTVFAIYIVISSIVYILGWLRAGFVIKKHGLVEGGRILIKQKDKSRGTILMLMGLGDRWFKGLVALPIVGLIFMTIWLIWSIVRGTLTVKVLLVVALYQILFGWMLGLLITYGVKALHGQKS